jgi:SAM-dependent methyltransferase
MKKQTYTFETALKCEMCGSPAGNHNVLGQRLNQSQGFRPKQKVGVTVSVAECVRCGLVYSQPMPVPSDIHDHYGLPPEDYWTPDKFQDTPGYFAGEIEISKRLLPFKEGMKALDIGAGLGKAVLALQRAGFDAFGIEPSAPFREKAIEIFGIVPERIQHSSVERAEYAPGSFDFITYGAVFEHIYHPAESLKKALGWLRRGGIIHIEVPNARYSLTKLMNFYYKVTGTNYVSHISPMHPPFHLYEFTERSFEELGKRLGFRIEHKTTEVCNIEFVPHPLHPVFRKYMELKGTGMQLIFFLRKN